MFVMTSSYLSVYYQVSSEPFLTLLVVLHVHVVKWITAVEVKGLYENLMAANVLERSVIAACTITGKWRKKKPVG